MYKTRDWLVFGRFREIRNNAQVTTAPHLKNGLDSRGEIGSSLVSLGAGCRVAFRIEAASFTLNRSSPSKPAGASRDLTLTRLNRFIGSRRLDKLFCSKDEAEIASAEMRWIDQHGSESLRRSFALFKTRF